MAPHIHLVRHAQGLHNVSATNHALVDPGLTAYGRRQCARLAAAFPADTSIALLAASPLRRTLDTALLGFPTHAATQKLVALPDAQEVGEWPCDTGRPLKVLEKEYGSTVDLSLVPDGWEHKQGRYRRDTETLQTRARDLRRWLREQSRELSDKGDVVLVTHGGFLHFLTEDWSDYKRFAGTGWGNTECRTYQFLDEEDPDAPLTETKESTSRRIIGTTMPRPDRSKFIKMQKARLGEQVKSNVSRRAIDSSGFSANLVSVKMRHPKFDCPPELDKLAITLE